LAVFSHKLFLRCIQGFVRGILKEKEQLKDLALDGIILKYFLKKYAESTDWIDVAQY